MRHIALLSNITTDMLVRKLKKTCEVYVPAGFDQWVGDVMNPDSGLYQAQVEAVFILIDGMPLRMMEHSERSELLDMYRDGIEAAADAFADIPVFASTIDFQAADIFSFKEGNPAYTEGASWYEFLMSLSGEKKNFYCWDIASRIADSGRKHVYSAKMWYMGSMPYGREGLTLIADEVKLALEAAFGQRKKIIALDLDNTLWGGVIGEDGVEGIVLSDHNEGARFRDFQFLLKEMERRGVVLAVNSKNNEADALEAIDKHPSMLLRQDDFVSQKINWNDKASNIKELEQELNLSEGSFVFVDDNPVEREIVGGECPEVTVADFPEDTTDLPVFAEDLFRREFKPLVLTAEDREKTQMYRKDAERKKLQKQSGGGMEGYIRNLKMCADIHRVRDDELARVHQLVNKSNQFNVTTKRYTEKEIEEYRRDPDADVFAVYAKDRFGEHGLIAVVIMVRSGESAAIDTFLMSCRVMGRGLENVILEQLAAMYGGEVKTLTGTFIPTAKNAPVAELYDRLGFALTGEKEGTKEYELDLAKPYPAVDYYEEVLVEGEKV